MNLTTIPSYTRTAEDDANDAALGAMIKQRNAEFLAGYRRKTDAERRAEVQRNLEAWVDFKNACREATT